MTAPDRALLGPIGRLRRRRECGQPAYREPLERRTGRSACATPRGSRCPGRLPVAALTLLLCALAAPARAQQAKLAVDDVCIAFAFSPRGDRIVYAALRTSRVRLPGERKSTLLEHDSIWQVTMDGHKRRLVDGKKLVVLDAKTLAKDRALISFRIRAIRIAPDDRTMTVEMATETFVPHGKAPGKVEKGEMTVLMDATGKLMDIGGSPSKGSIIVDAIDAAWLADGETVVYLTQAPGESLYSLHFLRPASGASGTILPDRAFTAVAWSPAHSVAAAIERNKDLSGPFRLVWIDLVHRTERTLATFPRFTGHLTVSPGGDQIAYFSDGNTIEIRSVTDPAKALSIQAPYGRYEWAADGRHLLLKRGPDNQTDQLIWIDLPGGQFHDAFHSLIYHNFHISPDGQWVGLTEPGVEYLKVFPAP